LHSFKFTKNDLTYLKNLNPNWDQSFYEYLESLDCSKVKVFAQSEGHFCSPRVPMLRVEGPLGVCQLLETTLLNLVNYASLIATNAARHRQAVGSDVVLLEFGLRRAQGPDGGMSASRYSYIGGYSGTSNVAAGKEFGIPVKGTHAHSYVTSFKNFDELKCRNRVELPCANEQKGENKMNFIKKVMDWRVKLDAKDTNTGELAAFTAYAMDYPSGFIALIDTYDTLKSGMLNFVVVGMSLLDAGYRPIGIRIDSGDIVAQSKTIKKYFQDIGKRYNSVEIRDALIFASDGIDESMLHDYNANGKVSAYGVGTNLVTCKKQPALGGVYKLVELDGSARIKLSEDPIKRTLPGKKNAYRIFNEAGEPICDVLACNENDELDKGKEYSFYHFSANSFGKVETVKIGSVNDLLTSVWPLAFDIGHLPKITELRTSCLKSVNELPEKHRRRHDPVPYPVYLTEKLYKMLETMIKEQSLR